MYKSCVLSKNIIPLYDSCGHNICFEITDKIKCLISNIDERKVENIFGIISSHEKSAYINETIFREAFYSARLSGVHMFEGDAREVLKSMQSRSTGEIAFINNYTALKHIFSDFQELIDDNVILKIYRLLYKNLMDDNILNSYKLRSTCVWDAHRNSIDFMESDALGEIQRINEFISFFNYYEFDTLVKSCIMYYYFLDNGPFYKGNDRVGRILIYMFLMKNGYNFIECFSISKLIYENKVNFENVFESSREKHCITEFIEAMLELYCKGNKIIFQRYKDSFGVGIVSKALEHKRDGLNKCQTKILNKIASGKINSVSIAQYQEFYKLSYREAKQELEGLEHCGYLKRIKDGKKFIFILNDFEKIDTIS